MTKVLYSAGMPPGSVRAAIINDQRHRTRMTCSIIRNEIQPSDTCEALPVEEKEMPAQGRKMKKLLLSHPKMTKKMVNIAIGTSPPRRLKPDMINKVGLWGPPTTITK